MLRSAACIRPLAPVAAPWRARTARTLPPASPRPAHFANRRSTPASPPAAFPLALLSPNVQADVADGLEEPVQALYLLFLLGFLVMGAYLVVRQVRRKDWGIPDANQGGGGW